VNAERAELEPAQFISQLQDVTVEEGEKATFECYITGNPMPEVRWCVLPVVILVLCPAFTLFLDLSWLYSC